MGRKKKLTLANAPPLPQKEDDGKPVFTSKAILLMACIGYNIRDAIVKEAPRYHKSLGPIPREAIMAAIKKLGLDHLL